MAFVTTGKMREKGSTVLADEHSKFEKKTQFCSTYNCLLEKRKLWLFIQIKSARYDRVANCVMNEYETAMKLQ